MATVRQSGGDYTSLSAACSAAEITIDIDQAWTVADTTAVAISTANTAITVSGDAKHPGYISGGNYYRLEVVGGDAIDINANGCVIDGLVVKCASTGASDEAVDIQGVTGSITLKNCLIYANDTRYNNQDGIYKSNNSCTLNVIQCIIWNFSRAGIHLQNFSGSSINVTANINSCTIYNNGRSGESDGISTGGVAVRQVDSINDDHIINIHNSIIIENKAGAAALDVIGTEAVISWNISYSIDSDNSIAGVLDSGSNNLATRTATDSDVPGTGAWVVFEDITTYPYDLRIKNNAENDAQDVHAVDTAHSLTIPTTDIVGTSRPQNTDYDSGVFEIAVGGGTTVTLTLNLDSYIQKQVQLTTDLSSHIQKEFSEQISIDSLINYVQQITADLNANLTAQRIESTQLDSYINQLKTVSNSLDALIISTETIQEFVDLDALLSARFEISTQLDSLISVSKEFNVDLDSLISRIEERTLDLDALLNIKNALSNQLDSLLSKSTFSIVDLDAQIFRLQSLNSSIDGLINKRITNDVALDSLIEISNSFQISLDSIISVRQSIDLNVDSYINQLQSVSNSLDALIISVVEGQEFVDLDSLITAQSLVNTQIDALIFIAKSDVIDLDSYLTSQVSLLNNLSSLIQKSNQSLVNGDALLTTLKVINSSIDAVLVSIVSNSITADLDGLITKNLGVSIDLGAQLNTSGVEITTLDSIIKSRQQLQSQFDAIIARELQQVIQLDGLVQKDFIIDTDLNSYIFTSNSLNNQIDAVLELRSLIELLMGGVLQKEIDIYSVFDALLLDPLIEPIFSSKLKFKVNSGITFKVNRRV